MSPQGKEDVIVCGCWGQSTNVSFNKVRGLMEFCWKPYICSCMLKAFHTEHAGITHKCVQKCTSNYTPQAVGSHIFVQKKLKGQFKWTIKITVKPQSFLTPEEHKDCLRTDYVSWWINLPFFTHPSALKSTTQIQLILSHQHPLTCCSQQEMI